MSQQTNWVPTSVDLEKPSAARAYDYVLGGNHNFAVDRELDAGHFEIEAPSGPGRYRAAVARTFVPSAGLCRAV